MAKYLIDANLPYYFQLWHNEDYIHLKDIDDSMPDHEVWNYAKTNNLIIITKDTDFSSRIMLSVPPPKVIHLRIGNMRMHEIHKFLNRVWKEVEILIETHKLVNVYLDGIEGVG